MHLQSNTVRERALLRAQQGASPPNIGSGKEEPHHKCPKILVSVISGVFLPQEEWCKLESLKGGKDDVYTIMKAAQSHTLCVSNNNNNNTKI